MFGDLPNLQRGTQILQQARLAETERTYKAALKKNPNNFDALHRLGYLRYEQQRYHDAPGFPLCS